MAKSTTQIFEFEGTLKYPKIQKDYPDEYRGTERWVVNLYLANDKQWKHFERSGIQSSPKEDEDGKYIVLRRDVTKKIGKDLVEFTPPFVYDKDNNLLVGYQNEDGKNIYQFNVKEGIDYEQVGPGVSIGNGTEAKVRVSVYDTSMGKGCRLENLKIIDLVEYTGGSGRMITAENELPGTPEPTSEGFVDDDDRNDEPVKAAPKSTKKKPSTPW